MPKDRHLKAVEAAFIGVDVSLLLFIASKHELRGQNSDSRKIHGVEAASPKGANSKEITSALQPGVLHLGTVNNCAVFLILFYCSAEGTRC